MGIAIDFPTDPHAVLLPEQRWFPGEDRPRKAIEAARAGDRVAATWAVEAAAWAATRRLLWGLLWGPLSVPGNINNSPEGTNEGCLQDPP